MGMALADAVMDDHYRSFSLGRPVTINRPTTPSVRVTDLSEGPVNPEPIRLDDDDELLEEFLSPRKLRAITGVENLDLVTYLDMQIDSAECSLGNFGAHLPNLKQLKLSNSIIPSIRDLGSALGNLEVLWMPRSCLECLDGMVTMGNLRELYIAYNEVTDVSPCGMLESLQILDLEGNLIDDLSSLAYLAMCPRLRRLTLEGNPICKNFRQEGDGEELTFRQVVLRTVPQLEFLDDFPAAEATVTSRVANATLEFDEHWNYIDVVLKESGLLAESSHYQQQQQAQRQAAEEEARKAEEDAARPLSRSRPPPSPSFRPASSGLRPSSASKRLGTPRRGASAVVSSRVVTPSTGSSSLISSARPMSGSSRPLSGSSRPSTGRPVSTASTGSHEESMELTDESELTAGVVVCGNISKALRSRRTGGKDGKAQEAAPAARVRPATALPGGVRPHASGAGGGMAREKPPVDDTGDDEEEDEAFKSLMKELMDWRAQHESLRAVIERQRAPQILRIDHDEAAPVDDDDGEDLDIQDDDGDSEEETPTAYVARAAAAPAPSEPRRLPSPPSSPPNGAGTSVRARRFHPQPPTRLEAAKAPVVPAIGTSAPVAPAPLHHKRPVTAMPTVGGGRVRLADLLPSRPQVPQERANHK